MNQQIQDMKDHFVARHRKQIEAGDGWVELISNCDAELTQLDPAYKVDQVKEKFGGLRYYFSPSNDVDKDTRLKMHDVVARYEALAWRTCEATGKPGVLMHSPTGWLKTLDPEYAGETLHYAGYRVVPAADQEDPEPTSPDMRD